MVENVEYIVASTDKTRRLDVYTTDTPQLIPLHALNQDGSVSDKPCIDLNNRVPTIAQSKGQNNVIVRDARTGKLYLQSTEQSRFLTYGCDASAPGNVVVQDHTGAWKPYADRDALHNEKVSYYSAVHDKQTFAHLSLPRLILLVSIKRAEDVEALIQDSMDKLTESNAKLDALAQIADLVVKIPADQHTIDIINTTINYKNEPVSIYTFLKDIGVDVDKLLSSQKQSASIQTELHMAQQAAFLKAYDTPETPYLSFDDQAKIDFLKKMQEEEDLSPIITHNRVEWDPIDNDALNTYVRNACAAGTLNPEDKITLVFHFGVVQSTVSFSVEDILVFRIGQKNYDKCWAAANAITADGFVMKSDLLDLVQTQQDDLNNISQETMINLQKLISKRDQAYLLGSVSNKLILNGNVMIARNL